jgi:methylmalonyl-CoA mutase N-terminal domain/subunit
MPSDKSDKGLRERRERWAREILDPSLAKSPERLPQEQFSTISSHVVPRLASVVDMEGKDLERDIAWPGEYPYTRGVHPTMYRTRLWTMRQFAGFGSAADTNARFHYLLANGQTGLSVAFDMPTLMGLDSDHPRSEGEVGIEGVAIDSLQDMKVLFDGIPLDEVSVSMTINAPAPVLLAMYIATAESQGVDPRLLRGTLQADILKEYIAQKEWIYPPEPSVKLMVDVFEYCSAYLPSYNPVSISGYHIREAGSTAIQELAFTLADGLAYVQAGIAAGLDVDSFAPRLSFFFNSHNDFFEEVCKLRAARRIWARQLRERFGAKRPESWKLRTHVQTAGCSLTAQQPLNNVVRVTIQAMAAVLGGCQSLHTNSLDETLSLPTEKAVTVALRTQQIIAEESGVANTVDPLGGSWYVERLTDEMEAGALEYIAKIEDMGGMIRAIDSGFPQKEIADAAFTYQRQVDSGEKVVVGVNKYQMPEEGDHHVDVHRVSREVEVVQRQRVADARRTRDGGAVSRALDGLASAARAGKNTFPHVLEAVRAEATVGEICDSLKAVFGEYRESPVF